MFTPSPLKRIVFFLTADFLISFFTLFLSYNLRFNFDIPNDFVDNFLQIFIVLILLKVVIFVYFRLYRTAWRFFSLYEVKKLIIAHILIYGVFTLIILLFRDNLMPFARSIIIIDFTLSLVFITLLRFSKRLIIESGSKTKYKNTLIIGANSSIKSLLNKSNLEYTPVAIVDEKKILKDTYLLNLKVYSFEDLEEVIKKKVLKL